MVRATTLTTVVMVMLSGLALAEPPERSITVRVLDPEGTPLEGVGVVVERSPLRASLPSAPAETDANGVATVTFDAAEDEHVVRLIVLDFRVSQLQRATDDDNVLSLEFFGLMDDMEQRRERRSFEPLGYPVRLDDLEPGSIWSTRARPMLIRPGLALDMASMFIHVVGHQGGQGGIVETNGAFELRLPAGSGPLWLTAPELMKPVARFVPLPPDDAPIVVSRADFETSDATGALSVARERLLEMFSVQFVRLDGQFGALATFGPKPEWGNLESVRLPAGYYYVLHYGEMFAKDGLDIALQVIAQGGAHEALATLPTIEIRGGETIDLDLSVEEIECATRNFVHAALYQPNPVDAFWSVVEKAE